MVGSIPVWSGSDAGIALNAFSRDACRKKGR
jgi:hypothetical protein